MNRYDPLIRKPFCQFSKPIRIIIKCPNNFPIAWDNWIEVIWVVLYSVIPNWFIHTGIYIDGEVCVHPWRQRIIIKICALLVILKQNKKMEWRINKIPIKYFLLTFLIRKKNKKELIIFPILVAVPNPPNFASFNFNWFFYFFCWDRKSVV